MSTIETQVWEKDEGSIYMKHVRDRTIGEVYDDLRQAVGEYPEGGDEYFSPMPHLASQCKWPTGRIVVFAVTGSSEGDYVHVEVHENDKHTLILLAKTFMGRDAAWTFARRLADLLGV